MIGRSWDAATSAERGQDDRRDWSVRVIDDSADATDGDGNQDLDLALEPARTEHDPVPDTVDVDGVPYQVDRCRKCNAVLVGVRAADACPGPNHTFDEFPRDEPVVRPSHSRDR